jgi:carboxylesterase
MENYEKKGPKAVIIFHAYTGTPNDVIAVGRALERENYTVMMPTFSGHDVDDPDELLEYGIEDWLKDGEKAYETLVNDGYTDISVFGLSLGGIIATHIMLKYDVQSYGVFSSPIMAEGETNIPENFWAWYQFKKKKLGLDEKEIAEKETEVLARLTKVLDRVNAHVKSMEPQYSEVALPVFIGQGAEDKMIDPDIAFEFQDALENAVIDFHWYEEAPHVITVGRVGKEVQKDLLAFLEEHTN